MEIYIFNFTVKKHIKKRIMKVNTYTLGNTQSGKRNQRRQGILIVHKQNKGNKNNRRVLGTMRKE
jgi:hypothetical protein